MLLCACKYKSKEEVKGRDRAVETEAMIARRSCTAFGIGLRHRMAWAASKLVS